MGGGDVKVLAGIGAWVGPYGVLTAFLMAVFVGGVMGLGLSLCQGKLLVVLRNTVIIGMSLLNAPRLGVEHVKEVGRACGGTKKGLPFAVPIWIGTVLTLFTPVQAWLLGR
jgi:prepilin peptidase CpaA